jgi:hypothetical protein
LETGIYQYLTLKEKGEREMEESSKGKMASRISRFRSKLAAFFGVSAVLNTPKSTSNSDPMIRFVRKQGGGATIKAVTTNRRVPSPVERARKHKRSHLNSIAAASRAENRHQKHF